MWALPAKQLPAPGASCLDDAASCGGAHSSSEAVSAFASATLRLISAFHPSSHRNVKRRESIAHPYSQRQGRKRRNGEGASRSQPVGQHQHSSNTERPPLATGGLRPGPERPPELTPQYGPRKKVLSSHTLSAIIRRVEGFRAGMFPQMCKNPWKVCETAPSPSISPLDALASQRCTESIALPDVAL